MLTYVMLFLIAYAAGAATVLLLLRQRERIRLDEAIARTAIVNTQVKSFTRKIGVGTEAAIGKFSELLLSINSSIKGTTSVVDRIRAKMSSCVTQGGGGADERDLKVIQRRYGMMLQEIMDQLNLTIQRKSEDISKLDFIRDSADKIKPFSSEIASIAFATKMISLNASIEAARAGVHGRTFEVVAGEIRKLAERSTNSAEEMENSLNQIVLFIETAIAELKDAIDVEGRFINSTVVLLQDVVMSVVESFVSISEAIEKTLGDSSTFRDEVNSIVFNLQFEDICNQMSQHTVHILDTIRDDLESLKLRKDSEEKKGEKSGSSAGDRILDSAKNLFTMEEERELAREALGSSPLSPDSEKSGDGKVLKKEMMPASSVAADSNVDDDDDVTFFDSTDDTPDAVPLSDDSARASVDDGVTFFDDPVDCDEQIVFDDKENVTFFDGPDSGDTDTGDEKRDDSKGRDDIEFNDDEDVTFF